MQAGIETRHVPANCKQPTQVTYHTVTKTYVNKVEHGIGGRSMHIKLRIASLLNQNPLVNTITKNIPSFSLDCVARGVDFFFLSQPIVVSMYQKENQ